MDVASSMTPMGLGGSADGRISIGEGADGKGRGGYAPGGTGILAQQRMVLPRAVTSTGPCTNSSGRA